MLCSGTTSLSQTGAYKLVACHVKGNQYAFTITYGTGYKSYNKGTITANRLTGRFEHQRRQRGLFGRPRIAPPSRAPLGIAPS